jgi:uncharacterized Tic20 family protein
VSTSSNLTIGPEERTLAALTHLSGLAGYVVPFAGVIVPIVLWIAKSDSPVVSSIAKQALLLNVVAFLLVAVTAVLWITIILIPVVILFWVLLALVALALPIYGAVKAFDGTYYTYPIIGVRPS